MLEFGREVLLLGTNQSGVGRVDAVAEFAAFLAIQDVGAGRFVHLLAHQRLFDEVLNLLDADRTEALGPGDELNAVGQRPSGGFGSQELRIASPVLHIVQTLQDRGFNLGFIERLFRTVTLDDFELFRLQQLLLQRLTYFVYVGGLKRADTLG